MIREFEYFGSSEQQFVFRPQVEELSKVHVAVRGLSDQLDRIHELGFHVDEGAAATEAAEGSKRVRAAVDALRGKLGIAETMVSTAAT